MKPELHPEIGQVRLRSPIILASGTCGYGLELLEAGALEGVGGLVTKATTLRPREGNRPPRIAETEYGLLNSIGLANPGVETVLADVLPRLEGFPCPVIVNVAGDTAGEFAEVVSRLESSAAHCGYELNVSCPNVESGGMAFGVCPRTVEEITRLARDRTSRLLSVKLTPNGGDIVEAAAAAEAGGADAVTVCNTFLGMKIDWRTGAAALSRGTGGYSSPALLPLVVARVWQVSRRSGIPVIASGGAWTAEAVLELLAAGACAVQVGTRILRDPFAPAGLHSRLLELVAE